MEDLFVGVFLALGHENNNIFAKSIILRDRCYLYQKYWFSCGKSNSKSIVFQLIVK